jgi:hypothetical protein
MIFQSFEEAGSMTTVSIEFKNDNDQPIYVQVDPWAGFYLLKKGDEIEIVAESDTSSPSFWVRESNRTRILTILDSTEYYVVIKGERILGSDYITDSRLCPHCLEVLDAEETLLTVCHCGKGTP